MTAINHTFNNYFHLIRHPGEAERKRDKLLTAIAILSCMTVIIPAVMGIGYALAGRVKRGALEPVVPPVGFTNYGLSCWLIAGVQSLLASRHFKEIINEPLVRWENVHLFDVDERGKFRQGWINRDETEEEFEARKELQGAFVDFFSVDENDSQEMNRSLRQLHERLYEIVESRKLIQGYQIGFKRIGTPADTRSLYNLLHYITGKDCVLKPFTTAVDSKLQEEIQEFLLTYEKPPKMLLIPLKGVKREMNINFTLDLSDILENTVYRLVAVKQCVPGHVIAAVLKEGQWFDCDDSRVLRRHQDTIHVGEGDCLIFDLQY